MSNSCTKTEGWLLAQKKTIAIAKDKRLNNIKQYLLNPNKCKYCDKILEYDDRRKKFCDSSCSATYNNSNRNISHRKNKVDKCCKSCTAPLSRNAAIYCSNKCQGEYQYKSKVGLWKAGQFPKSEYMPIHIRRYMMESVNNKCQKCGWCEVNPKTGLIPLQIDHIDGDCTNHAEVNLAVLCPNCHSLTPTYGALNKGNGKREQRRKRRMI